jgi:5'-deoxynucleotidase YfbR-like HD superfamily hydrolase
MLHHRLRSGGKVKRYHTVDTIKNETVAQHTYGVMSIIADLCHGVPSTNLMMAALCHDIAEQVTGDIPAPAKWDYPELSEAIKNAEAKIEEEYGVVYRLTPTEQTLLKAADTLDLIYFCIEERQLGNIGIESIYYKGIGALGKLPYNPSVIAKVNEAKLIWEELLK